MVLGFAKILWKYTKAHSLYAAVAVYILFSCILKIFTGVNITIPCLIKTIFNVSCPGCGLTHAFIDLLKLNFVGAWEHNPLIFLVLPAGAYFILTHFLKYRKSQLTHQMNALN